MNGKPALSTVPPLRGKITFRHAIQKNTKRISKVLSCLAPSGDWHEERGMGILKNRVSQMVLFNTSQQFARHTAETTGPGK